MLSNLCKDFHGLFFIRPRYALFYGPPLGLFSLHSCVCLASFSSYLTSKKIMRVKGHWKSLTPFNRLRTSSYSPSTVIMAISRTVRRCQQHKAPQYLTDCVTWASDIASRQRLRSANRHQLLVPRYQLSSLGRRSFAVAGPTTWNSLSADLCDPTCSDESFRRSLKTFLFAKY